MACCAWWVCAAHTVLAIKKLKQANTIINWRATLSLRWWLSCGNALAAVQINFNFLLPPAYLLSVRRMFRFSFAAFAVLWANCLTKRTVYMCATHIGFIQVQLSQILKRMIFSSTFSFNSLLVFAVIWLLWFVKPHGSALVEPYRSTGPLGLWSFLVYF